MGRPLGNMHKIASFCLAHFAAYHNIQLSFDNIKGLVLVVMDMDYSYQAVQLPRHDTVDRCQAQRRKIRYARPIRAIRG